MKYFNVHTHIFSARHVPEYVVGQNRWWFKIKVSQLRQMNGFLIGTLNVLARITFRNKKFKRIAAFGKLGLGTDQLEQYEYLIDYYENKGESFRFVVLPMDMENMGAGSISSPLTTQLYELIVMRQNPKLANKILPFLPIDPRRKEFKDDEDVLKFVKFYFEKYGFIGIKLYPALGYMPFDKKLFKMYDWCIKNNVPIMTHCIAGVTHWQGDMSNWQAMMPKDVPGFVPDKEWNELPAKDKLKRRDLFQNNFTQPQNYKTLVQELDKADIKNANQLKICFGHFGMESNDWFNDCKNLIAEFDNFYADISYVIADKKLIKNIREVCGNAFEQKNKVLFGTDFFVVSKEKEENEILKHFQENGLSLSPYADINAERYLSSTFFTP
jgi:predicted TIM-barrel fold metal-dependent hydrolase